MRKDIPAQQNRHQTYSQWNQLCGKLEMKSIHSSNSQSSVPEEDFSHTNYNKMKQENVSHMVTELPSLTEHEDTQLIQAIYPQKVEQLERNQDKQSGLTSNSQHFTKQLHDFHPNNEEVIHEVNLLEDSAYSSKELQCSESVKIYPKKASFDLLEKPIYSVEDRKIVKEVALVQKQEVSNSNTKNKQKLRQFSIACQRNNLKINGSQEKQKDIKAKPKKKNEQKPANIDEDYEMKYNLEFEEYFHQCKFDFCGQKCAEGNQIYFVCVEKNCSSEANQCKEDNCKTCKDNHKNCYLKFTTDMFNKSLERNLSRQKKTMQIVYETYSNILTQIKQNRKKIMRLLCIQGVNESLFGKLQQRYKIYNYISLKSSEVLNVLEMLNSQSEKNEFKERKIYEKMKKDQKEIMEKLQQEMHLLLEPYASSELNILNSHLITNKCDVKFVLEHLSFPKDMKLIYRASEHEFSIKKFHEICDKEENTFTVIKTEFGKLIGGFTPLKWSNKQGRDRSNKTFLLSISMKQKMEHIKHGQSAIYYSDSFGPAFGGLFEARDIEIFEENGLLNCITNFPNAYNWKKFFTSNQDSWRFLTGVQEGKKCRVMDYEVFKVCFWK